MKGGCQVSKGNLAQRNKVCCHNRSSWSYRLEPESTMLEKIRKALTIRSVTVREMLAEALGMFVVMVRRRWAQLCVCVCVCRESGRVFASAACKVSGFLAHPRGCSGVSCYCSPLCSDRVAASHW